MSIFRRVGKSKARAPVPAAAPALESADLTDSDEEEGRPGLGGPAEPSLAESSAGTATNAGELRINVVSGHGLVPGETYAKILVKAGDGARSERTLTARSVGDVLQWSGAHFRFERIWSPSVQVVVMLKNYNRLGANDRLGQIGFRLEELELPPSGTLITKVFTVGPMREGGRRGAVAPQGTVTLQVGWSSENADEAEMAMLKEQKKSRLKEKRRYLRFVSGPDEKGEGGDGSNDGEMAEHEEGMADVTNSDEYRQLREEQEALIQKRIANPMRPGEYRLQVSEARRRRQPAASQPPARRGSPCYPYP
jgi:hypothetical protein